MLESLHLCWVDCTFSFLFLLMYVRIRGKSVGPLDNAKVQELVRQGKISRASEVSDDGKNWVRASEYGSLFASDGAGERGVWNGNLVDSSATPSKPRGMNDFLPASAKTDEPVIWFYSTDGRAGFGPHTRTEIGVLIRQGTLKPDGLVWKQGEMADTVRYTQDFAEFLIPSGKPEKTTQDKSDSAEKNVPGTAKQDSAAAASANASSQVSPVIREALRVGPWIMFLAIIASIGVVGVALGLLGGFCFIWSHLTLGYSLFFGLSILGTITLMVLPLLTLWKLQNAVANLAIEPNEAKLKEVLRRYYGIVRSLVVHLLILAALLGISFLLSISVIGKLSAVLGA